jgi:dihydrolipoamide dehydrogenase
MIHKNAELRTMEIKDGKVHYQLCISQDLCHWFEADKALISVGRIANTEGLGLEKIGVKLKPNGYLFDVDSQTSVPHIYAVGDLTADISLVNVAEQEGRHAIEQIVGLKPRPLRYDNISTIMFLNPEIAGVGMNEQQAQAAKVPYRMAVLDYRNIARAIAMRNTIGFFKILVTDEDNPKILGMRAIGEHASSAIQAVALMIGTETTIDQLADMIHPHPSIVEGIQEALRMLLGRPIFKDWYPNPYSKVVRWTPKPTEIAAI